MDVQRAVLLLPTCYNVAKGTHNRNVRVMCVTIRS